MRMALNSPLTLSPTAHWIHLLQTCVVTTASLLYYLPTYVGALVRWCEWLIALTALLKRVMSATSHCLTDPVTHLPHNLTVTLCHTHGCDRHRESTRVVTADGCKWYDEIMTGE